MPLFARACDECKRRKVRCDAANPCANCRIAGLACAFQIQPRRRGRKPRAGGSLGADRASPEAAPATPTAEWPPSSPSFLTQQQHQPTTQPSPSHLTPPALQHAPSISTLSASPRGPFAPLGIHGNGSLHTQPGAAARIRHSLVLEIGSILTFTDIDTAAAAPDVDHLLDPVLGIMHKCVDLFVQYIFPNTPIAHEPSLRRAVSDMSTADESTSLSSMRNFTLITALCAFISSVVPDNPLVSSYPGLRAVSLTWPFYHASRAMLRLYEELDLEAPVASSYTSRIWQSSALQNVTGKNGVAWHVSGEVTVMAMRTRLYDEETLLSFAQTSPLESQLLRANFWLIYLIDRTATAFEGRPSVMSDILSHGLLTLGEQGPRPEPLLDPTNPLNSQATEEELIRGFHLKTRLWATVADFMHRLKSFANRKESAPTTTTTDDDDDDWAELVRVHRTFLGILDDLPPCLRSPNSAGSTAVNEDTTTSYRAQSFWALRNNILSVYHCMRLVILHECMHQNIPRVLGLENEAESLAIRQLEIVQDFLLEMHLVPFMCLKVQGEAAIQRIRRVGAISLEMVNHAINSTFHKRATLQFNQILDILTSLDSKATATELGAGIMATDPNSAAIEQMT